MKVKEEAQQDGPASFGSLPVTDQLEILVNAIPPGKVASYGVVGGCCQPPLSGYFCGRLLGRIGGQMPWWRVVAKDGSLAVTRKNPELGRDAREVLKEEGARFTEDGKVHLACFVTAAQLEERMPQGEIPSAESASPGPGDA